MYIRLTFFMIFNKINSINKMRIKNWKGAFENKVKFIYDIKYWFGYKINKSKINNKSQSKQCEHLHHLPEIGHQILQKESEVYPHKITPYQITDHTHHQLNLNICGNHCNKSSFFLNNFVNCWNMKSVTWTDLRKESKSKKQRYINNLTH